MIIAKYKGFDDLKKIDETIIKETKYIALVTFVLSIFLQSVFLIIGKWDYTVLLGNLLGAITAVLNFFLMGLSVQSSLELEVKDAKNRMKLSQMFRTLLMFIIAVIGYTVSVFNLIAVIIPYLFPRVAVFFRAISIKKQK